jgi:hypothetical protein
MWVEWMQKSSIPRKRDPNTDIPHVHHCIQEKHTHHIELYVWCVHGQRVEHSNHNQANEELNNQQNDQRDVLEEYHHTE